MKALIFVEKACQLWYTSGSSNKLKVIKIFKKLYYNLFYNLILCKLRLIGRFRKIRIGFWVTEPSKWTCQTFYNLLKNDKHFEPFILLSCFKNQQAGINTKEHYSKTKAFFEQKGENIIETFDLTDYSFKNLNKFNLDIIFYQQPWQIHDIQRPEKTHKRSLLCYIPYCFYSMDSWLNYLPKFHGLMWKYFVETDFHKQEYKKVFGAKNCIATGSTKLDEYHFINSEQAEKCWKTQDKKRIIYAPHHSFNDGLHEVATFQENGKFILELAKSHPETEWIFRPHPVFKDRVVKNSIMNEDELNAYYREWEQIGTISTGENYYEMFSSSDCLITDCISFLAEYAPTGKPLLHLRKDSQKEEFNTLIKKIDEGYYQIFSNKELQETFEHVVLNGDDTLAKLREKNKSILPTDITASQNIYDYLKKELWL